MTLGDRITVIDKGRLQQVGTPRDLHTQPRNRFVAGFLGSPSMNFTTVHLGSERPTVTLGGHDFEIPDAMRRRPDLARYAGSDILLGLRPAAFSIATPGIGPALTVNPLGLEALGDDKARAVRATDRGHPGRS